MRGKCHSFPRMFRLHLLAAAALLAGALPALAQENPAAPADDTASLRASIEQQTRRIDLLTEQVERLAKMLEQRGDAAPDVSNAPRATAVGPGDMPPGTGPEPSRPGTTHVVKKGENLTSIAKQYGVAIDALAAANHIEDARKLQIGQVLTVPEPAPEKSPEQTAPTETP